MIDQEGAQGLMKAVSGAKFPRMAISRSAVVFLLAALGFAASPAGAARTVGLDNGLTLRIHDGVELAARLEFRMDRCFLRLDGAGEVELFTGPEDPRLLRRVDAFSPLAAAPVVEALAAVRGIEPNMAVEIYLLPSPPVAAAGSFSRGNAIFLSPAFGPVPEGAIAPLVVHELGHVLTWGYFDPRPDLWAAYMLRRGLDEQNNGPAAHADRAREILAEDLRCLFGGVTARAGGTIENPNLPVPQAVAGLNEFLAASLRGRPGNAPLARSSAAPNPCNPRTVVALDLAGAVAPAAAGRLEIFDARGRRVRAVAGGSLDSGRLAITWDGRDDGGRRVPTGRYLYRISCGSAQGKGALTVVR